MWLHPAYLLKGRSIWEVTTPVDSLWDRRKKKSSILRGEAQPFNEIQSEKWRYIYIYILIRRIAQGPMENGSSIRPSQWVHELAEKSLAQNR